MNKKEQSEPVIDRHPLNTLGILTAGTQLGSTVIQKMAKRPMILFCNGYYLLPLASIAIKIANKFWQKRSI